MNIDDFITPEDRGSAAYGACVLVWGAAGLTLGSIVQPGLGTAVGFGAGLMWAKSTCGTLKDRVKARLSQGKTVMTDADFALLKKGVREMQPSLSNAEVLAVIHAAAKDLRV